MAPPGGRPKPLDWHKHGERLRHVAAAGRAFTWSPAARAAAANPER
jgi:hypothetical protein